MIDIHVNYELTGVFYEYIIYGVYYIIKIRKQLLHFADTLNE